MESLLRFLLRLLLVPLGGAVAIMVALTVVLIAHWSEIVALAHAGAANDQDDWLLALVFAGPIYALLLSMVMIVAAAPAVIGSLIAEAFAFRSWIYHALNGGLSAAIGWALVQDDAQQQYGFLTEPKAMVAAGLAGGLAYWLVAGWTAGFWMPVFRRQPPPIPLPPIPPQAQIPG
jgi:hypothetical protein